MSKMATVRECDRCHRRFESRRKNQRFCKLDPAGCCRELYWSESRRKALPAGLGRRRPPRFEVGQTVADLVEDLHGLGFKGTRQSIVEYALEELIAREMKGVRRAS